MSCEEAIRHFETLQKRYTKQHNGTACEYVELALDALRAPERIEHENKSLRHFIEANASKLAAEFACLTAELSALTAENARLRAELEAANKAIANAIMLLEPTSRGYVMFRTARVELEKWRDRERGPQEGANP